MNADGWQFPQLWRCEPGDFTPDGTPAVFRSAPHAVMAIRLQYRREVMNQSEDQLEQSLIHYQWSWDHFVETASTMCRTIERVEADDINGARSIWNDVCQVKADRAFRVVLAEREPYKGRNLITHAWKHYGSPNPPSVPSSERDRTLRPLDSTAAWERSAGTCTGCGIATISHAQRDRLHRVMKKNLGLFNMEPTYEQHNGKQAPLWNIVTIAAKGVAEHVVPRCQGGPTTVANLTNACAGCNYSRGDIPLEAMRVAAYERPQSETG